MYRCFDGNSENDDDTATNEESACRSNANHEK